MMSGSTAKLEVACWLLKEIHCEPKLRVLDGEINTVFLTTLALMLRPDRFKHA